ncbi:Ubiquitin homeostasis protein [Lachnellula occidentalis]|uniref:Ubiquitin homeostasis protein n=1 Tax=Lachnellula occidentalis TaxID=215460 RepID=A0A8H8UHG9_9HELO|nr:Ubiquitin homeostasis protein [Lachnellula occidentalis]
MAEYKLSASLAGHEDDVKAVIFPSSKAVISASRDQTVRIWNLLSDNPPLFDASICSNATGFVNSVTYLPASAEYPEGLVISGGKDTLLDVRQPSKAPTDNAEALLVGHSSNICALDVDPAGRFIVSGGWDAEARIWPVGKWECQAVLRGHEGSVWGVVAYDSETIITGCADTKIRVFNTNGKLLRTISAGQHPVRALCKIPRGHPSGADFGSADNEGTIRLWTLGGQQVAQMSGHESFVYSLVCSPSGELLSAGEDRTVRIWKGTECVQTITHPAISVWGVAVCAENGDIVTAASDRIARVFTRDPARAADAETTKFFEDSVKESSIPQQQLPDVNKEKLPGPEFLVQKAGTKDGQVQMIRELNGAVTAHQWSVGQGQWINVGTVVDAVGSSGKKVEYLGKEYDYVFEVDIEDGKPALKLPYNLSQNPYEAATTFIANNELPVTYLDQVADFITSNTKGATIGQAQEQVSAPDPWGSDNRYRPGGESAAASTPAPPKIIPQTAYLNITTGRIPAIQKKLGELNQALLADGHKDVSLNPVELSQLASLCKHLESNGATKTSQSISGGLDLAVKICTTWPYKDRLPGLDLLRLLAVAPQTATFSHSRGGNIIDVFEQGATETQPPTLNFLMMAIRGFANLFESPEGRTLAVNEFEKIQSIVGTAIASSTDRNLGVAATTLYINYAVYFKTASQSSSFEHAIKIIDTLGTTLSTQVDSEAVYRALVATGTLLTLDDETRIAAKDVYSIDKRVSAALAKAVDPRIKNAAREIATLLKA